MPAFDAVRRIARRIFHSKPDDGDLAPGPAARALAEFLSGVEGSSLIWCGCGELLIPVVYSDRQDAEVIALGCIHGHGRVLVASGVLIEGGRHVEARP
jgi:hypothetical protein